MQQSDTEKEEQFGLKLNPIRSTHFPFNTFNALNAFADFSQLMEELYAEGDAVSADGWKDRSGNH